MTALILSVMLLVPAYLFMLFNLIFGFNPDRMYYLLAIFLVSHVYVIVCQHASYLVDKALMKHKHTIALYFLLAGILVGAAWLATRFHVTHDVHPDYYLRYCIFNLSFPFIFPAADYLYALYLFLDSRK